MIESRGVGAEGERLVGEHGGRKEITRKQLNGKKRKQNKRQEKTGEGEEGIEGKKGRRE